MTSTVLYATGANHWMGVEAVGGRLKLHVHHLVFTSHAFNIQNHELVVARGDIAEAHETRLSWVSKTLTIHLHSGGVERFVIPKRTEWVARLGQPDIVPEG